MFSQVECEESLRKNFPEIYRIAMRNSWWNNISPLRIWISFASSGYVYHLLGLEHTLSYLRGALSPRDYGRLTKDLFNPNNFWGHVTEVCTARWLITRGLTIVEVEKSYGNSKPDFTVSDGQDEGVIECKTVLSSPSHELTLSPEDALVYLMKDVNLPGHVSFHDLLTNESQVYELFCEFLEWLATDTLSGYNARPVTKTLPSGYMFTIDYSVPGSWGVVGSRTPNLYPTEHDTRKFVGDATTKKNQVGNHSGYNSIVLDASFFPALTLPFNGKPLTDQWFCENDSEGIISSILFVGLNLPEGTLMPSPTMYTNPYSHFTSNVIHYLLLQPPTLTWENFISGF